MKTFQNNFTTPEQSKRLLELGVPANSADCYLTRFGIDEDWEVKVLNYDKYSDVVIGNQDYCIPCWSVGRLVEICRTCLPKKEYDQAFEEMDSAKDVMDVWLAAVSNNTPVFDFSKLED